ncbi:MAG: hypothetical protein JXA11_11795 [Phycisphaerae bacterium]|nr:hypothetical protein [Phycisphaerae bacterium]
MSHGGRTQPRPQAKFRRQHQEIEGDAWIDPYRKALTRKLILCHYCGYGPSKIPADGVCPKCGMGSWEYSVVSQRLLPAQDEE